MSVCPQVSPHVTITHDALDLTVQSLWPQPCPPPDMRPEDPSTPSSDPPDMRLADHPWPSPASDYHWRPVQICSLDITVQVLQELHLVAIQGVTVSTSRACSRSKNSVMNQKPGLQSCDCCRNTDRVWTWGGKSKFFP